MKTFKLYKKQSDGTYLYVKFYIADSLKNSLDGLGFYCQGKLTDWYKTNFKVSGL